MAELNAYDAEARAGKLLHGLASGRDPPSRGVLVLRRLARAPELARALMMPSDLLLLDEPTNHLDLDAVYWLEQWLLKYPARCC
jgi:ATP-binding cassette subfamily F protein 3